jgi:uncharacterized repeat protein (TIGR01451 family)
MLVKHKSPRRVLRWAAVVALTVLAVVLGVGSAAAQGSKGVDFWLTFPSNDPTNTAKAGQTLQVLISSDSQTSGTVAIPGLAQGFTQAFSVNPGAVTTVTLPSAAEIQSSDAAVSNGIHVTAAAPVTVYGLSQIAKSTDAYVGLPTDTIGTDYIALGYGGENQSRPSELAFVATQDGTTVTVTPATALAGHAAGVPFQVSLGQGQTYQLQAGAIGDVTGTLVSSNKPISMFSGSECGDVPDVPLTFACNYLLEQLPPTTSWGKSFVTMPLASRQNGDTFRILASQDSTTVQVNGAASTLNRAQFKELIVSGPAQIVADKPVLVMQYSHGTDYDGVTSDPFEMLVPPTQQFLDSYTVSTPAASFAINFVNVVAPNAAVGSIVLDGRAISSDQFAPIGTSGFSGAQVSVGVGSHTLTGPAAFGAWSYGFAAADGYGYPGGLSLPAFAVPASLSLAPKTGSGQVGTQQCVTATVKDRAGSPLQNARVDFDTSGANAVSGLQFTNDSGQAALCYTGANAGTDTLTARIGALSDTAQRTWTGGAAGPSGPSGLVPPSDLALVLAGPRSARVGESITFTATISNRGPDIGTGVSLKVPVPAGATLTSAVLSSGGPCTAATGTVTCFAGTMLTGASLTATVVLSTTQVGPLSVSASVAADNDPLPGNNAATATTTVLSLTAPPLPPPPPDTPGTFNAIAVGSVNADGVTQTPDKVFQIESGDVVDVSGGAITLTASNGSYASFANAPLTAVRSTSSASSAAATVPARFRINQAASAGAVTQLTLVGGSFAVCNKGRSLAATNTTPVRQLWGSATGSFRTKARYSSATVRGTIWLTQDRCDGTLTRVVESAVDVFDLTLKKTIRLGPGKSYLAKPKQAAKKAAKARKPTPLAVYVVRPGDSLYTIAAAKLGDGNRWSQIARLNGIGPPYAVEAGTRLRLPRR